MFVSDLLKLEKTPIIHKPTIVIKRPYRILYSVPTLFIVNAIIIIELVVSERVIQN